jgi:AcrR family transcriptional regulator
VFEYNIWPEESKTTTASPNESITALASGENGAARCCSLLMLMSRYGYARGVSKVSPTLSASGVCSYFDQAFKQGGWMPKQASEGSKRAILDATLASLIEQGAGGVTIDRVAKRAGVAKGLVNYHFQTKDRLLAAAVEVLSRRRQARWTEAFSALDLNSVVDDTWRLIRTEQGEGVLRATISLYGETGQHLRTAVHQATAGFAKLVAQGVEQLLHRAGARSRVPADQLGWLVAAVIDGAQLQLGSGVSAEIVENAYAAAWLGVLGLAA